MQGRGKQLHNLLRSLEQLGEPPHCQLEVRVGYHRILVKQKLVITYYCNYSTVTSLANPALRSGSEALRHVQTVMRRLLRKM